jgi:hypothetical protein
MHKAGYRTCFIGKFGVMTQGKQESEMYLMNRKDIPKWEVVRGERYIINKIIRQKIVRL